MFNVNNLNSMSFRQMIFFWFNISVFDEESLLRALQSLSSYCFAFVFEIFAFDIVLQ